MMIQARLKRIEQARQKAADAEAQQILNDLGYWTEEEIETALTELQTWRKGLGVEIPDWINRETDRQRMEGQKVDFR